MSAHVTTHVTTEEPTPAPRNRRGPRANTHARAEVLRMLKDDHRAVKMAFREFGRLHLLDDAQACSDLVRQICMELELHTRLEEEVFYPKVKAVLPRHAVIDDAEVEHQTMRMLIDQVRRTRAGDPLQAASFRVLGEYVKHHVKDEEGEMFRQLSHARVDWAPLLEDMLERLRALMDAWAPEDAEGADLPHGAAPDVRQVHDGHGLRSGRPS